jgi:alanine-glyoxylate transaminase / serine-glyoxylate transaminase / serine-pyruvate transaminase
MPSLFPGVCELEHFISGNDILKDSASSHSLPSHFSYLSHSSGTFGMESVARQFAYGHHSLVLRNGWFSYRWTEILEMGQEQQAWGPHTTHTVLKAVPMLDAEDPLAEPQPQYTPAPMEQVLERIQAERPKVFFLPHVETSTGLLVPETYLRQVADAMHRVGGLLVVDCIASGTVWLDMRALGIDVIISAPQKGWTGPPCAALVMLSERAKQVLDAQPPNQESSFSLSLKRWSAIMDAYVKGGFAYHTTMPTDALRDFHQVTVEALELGMGHLKEQQWDLGRRARALLAARGLRSVAAPGSAAPGVLVFYSPGHNDIDNPVLMRAFQQQAQLQIAMGVPWKIDEPAGLKTFRIGLFGLPKLTRVEETLATLEESLDRVLEHLYQEYPHVRP